MSCGASRTIRIIDALGAHIPNAVASLTDLPPKAMGIRDTLDAEMVQRVLDRVITNTRFQVCRLVSDGRKWCDWDWRDCVLDARVLGIGDLLCRCIF
ncbi:MAG: hypothetical protein CVV17_00195 [Gammaproteobacteria bacterium HGW-Gammaproteobacteria-7]|nr:MAG: hypothetical protein CVV17_00195 [Gammaproteobacteria bacterium HGW-Gammaproteobacteria-7]